MKKRTTILIASLTFLLIAGHSFADQPLKGYVYYHEDESRPLPDVVVGLYNANNVLITTTTTNFQGKYIFTNVAYGTYTVRGISSALELYDGGGVDVNDAELIQGMIGSNQPIAEMEYVAADIIADGDIQENDHNACLDIIAGLDNPYWVFESVTIEHNGTKTNVPTMGGSSSGDVNGTFVPTSRHEKIVETSYFAKSFTRNFSIEVNIDKSASVNGMKLEISYPAEIDITGITSQVGDFDKVNITNDKIILVWLDQKSLSINADQPVVIINGTANKNYSGKDIKLEIENQSHFLSNGEIFTPEFTLPYLTITENDYLSNGYPNPANDMTKVFFTLPCNLNTQLNIYSLTGQLVKTIINDEMTSGQHSVEIPVADLKEGVYFYSLTTSGDFKINQSRRLVVVH